MNRRVRHANAALGHHRHEISITMPVNAAEPAKTDQLVTSRKIRKILVAREGIEPPTRGFSVRCRVFQGFINQSLAASCRPLPRHTKAQSWHTQSELVTFLAQDQRLLESGVTLSVHCTGAIVNPSRGKGPLKCAAPRNAERTASRFV